MHTCNELPPFKNESEYRAHVFKWPEDEKFAPFLIFEALGIQAMKRWLTTIWVCKFREIANFFLSWMVVGVRQSLRPPGHGVLANQDTHNMHHQGLALQANTLINLPPRATNVINHLTSISWRELVILSASLDWYCVSWPWTVCGIKKPMKGIRNVLEYLSSLINNASDKLTKFMCLALLWNYCINHITFSSNMRTCWINQYHC